VRVRARACVRVRVCVYVRVWGGASLRSGSTTEVGHFGFVV